MGLTFLDFMTEGKLPRKKERLISSDNWTEISLLSNFKIFVGMLLGVTGFIGFRDKILFSLFILLSGFIKNELMSILERK